MSNTLARALRIAGPANMIASAGDTNRPEVYADRIKRDFHLDDYADAWVLYDSDRPYWENYYRAQPKGPANQEFVRDSAAAAGVPSRNNVFEYGFPGSSLARPLKGEAPTLRAPNQPAWNSAFVRDSANAAGIPGRNNVFEYGYPGTDSSTQDVHPGVRGLSPRSEVQPFQPSPSVVQSVPRGLPALLAEVSGFDGPNAETGGPATAPAAGGLLGLIQEYLRNNPAASR